MPSAHALLFPPFRLDSTEERLWRDSQAISLRRKTFAMLRYLVEHAGQLVTKDELLAAVWPGTVVTEGLLSGCINELRKALDDDPKSPHFIETVHGRGYRWIAPLTTAPPIQSPRSKVQSPQLTTENWQLASPLVGRETELTQLHEWLEKVLRGERQVVFVTGEPGIGKTTTVDAFLAQVVTSGHVQSLEAPPSSLLLVGRGQCIEHYGAGEAYLPVLEALGRLCRAQAGQDLITLLKQHAPTWLVQMPTLLADTELEAVQRRVQGATQERMLREMADALEVLTGVGTTHASSLLILVLEDLHWSDVSTLDLLAFLARRREPARLLVIGTYRPVEMVSPEHPLRAVTQELQPASPL